VPATGQRLSDASLRGVLAVLSAAPASLARQAAHAYVGKRGVTIVMRNGLAVYFGDSSRPHAKWLALALVLASERSAGAKYIDVRVPERSAAGFAPGAAPPQGSSSEPSSSAQSTAEAGGPQQSITAALAAGLEKAVGKEQASGAASNTPGATEWWKEASGEARSGESSRRTTNAHSESAAGGESSAGGRSESATGTSAETSSEAHAGGHYRINTDSHPLVESECCGGLGARPRVECFDVQRLLRYSTASLTGRSSLHNVIIPTVRQASLHRTLISY
jgi:hypothetical protein